MANLKICYDTISVSSLTISLNSFSKKYGLAITEEEISYDTTQ
jgi:hypothetical protein